MSAPANIAIIGGGGIGCLLAAELVGAGHSVTLCVRTPFDKLHIETSGHRRAVNVPIMTTPEGAKPVRWLFITTKAQDTAETEPWLRTLCGESTIIVMIQNGIDHVERLPPNTRHAAVIPVIMYCGAERTAPGHVIQPGAPRMIVPRSDVSPLLRGLCEGTAYGFVEDDDFKTAMWQKLMGNVAANPVTALTSRRGEVFRDDSVQSLLPAMLKEVVAVACAEGALLSGEDVGRAVAFVSGLADDAGTSMLYDRLSGTPLENELITGALIRVADKHALNVPVNRTIHALLTLVSRRAPQRPA